MTRQAIDHGMRESVEPHVSELRGARPAALHAPFLAVAEKPLLELVLRRAQGNRGKAAECPCINGNTLRRKLQAHDLVK